MGAKKVFLQLLLYQLLLDAPLAASTNVAKTPDVFLCALALLWLVRLLALVSVVLFRLSLIHL